MAKVNVKARQFVAENNHLSTSAIFALAQKKGMKISLAQVSYYKNLINKAAKQGKAREEISSQEDHVGVDLVQQMKMRIAVLENTVGALLVTIGNLVKVR